MRCSLVYIAPFLIGYSLPMHVIAQSFELVQSFEFQSELRKVNGVSAADYDLDGDPDLFLVAEEIFDENDPLTWSRLLRNDDGLRFTDVTRESGLVNYQSSTNEGLVMGSKMGASWGDYNNDGYPDLFLSNYGLDELWRNEGNGKFTNVTDIAGIAGCQFCYSTTGLWWDFDIDGDLDLYVSDWIKENRLYRNDGDGSFAEITTEAGVGDNRNTFAALPIDVNHDGRLDLYLANDAQDNRLYLNNGRDQFTDETTRFGLQNEGNGMGMDICDYNNDGHFDIYVTNIFRFEPNPFFVNGGNGLFSNRSTALGIDDTGWGWGARFFDADHDLDEDLYVVNGHKSSFAQDDRNKFFENGQFGFNDLSEVLGVDNVAYAMGLEVFDYDGDGDFDMLVGNREAPSSLYRNTSIENRDGAANWIQIELEGTVSNRNAFGSTVKITCAGKEYFRYHTGMNLFGQSIKPVHFGLGNHQLVEKIEITWPDGVIETFTQVEANQVLRIRENADKNLVTAVDFDAQKQQSISIFPNPFNNAITIKIGNGRTVMGRFELINAAGQSMFKKSFAIDQAGTEFTIDGDLDLTPGLYLYSLSINGSTYTGRLMKTSN